MSGEPAEIPSFLPEDIGPRPRVPIHHDEIRAMGSIASIIVDLLLDPAPSTITVEGIIAVSVNRSKVLAQMAVSGEVGRVGLLVGHVLATMEVAGVATCQPSLRMGFQNSKIDYMKCSISCGPKMTSPETRETVKALMNYWSMSVIDESPIAFSRAMLQVYAKPKG